MDTRDSLSQSQQLIQSSLNGPNSGSSETIDFTPSRAQTKPRKKTGSSKPKSSRKFKGGFIVAIDGPAGAGKSTVSRQLADALEGLLLDTGGMYRAVAYYAIREGVDRPGDIGKVARRLNFDVDPSSRKLLVNGEDLGSRIRTEEVSNNASAMSRFASVRTSLTSRQRALGKKWALKMPVVVEGRDIGTVVFKQAPFKFFVTASPEVRAVRRLAQLEKQGITGLTLKSVIRQNEDRDKQDSTRKLAPLKCAEDAVIVDTSSMGIHQVVRFMADHILLKRESGFKK